MDLTILDYIYAERVVLGCGIPDYRGRYQYQGQRGITGPKAVAA